MTSKISEEETKQFYDRIIDQGNVVRNLKAAKAPADQFSEALEVSVNQIIELFPTHFSSASKKTKNRLQRSNWSRIFTSWR